MKMCRFVLAVLVIATSLSAASSAGAATFTVSPGTHGSSDSTCRPCRSIGGAITKAGALAGTDRINVAAGSYSERLNVRPTNTVLLVGTGTVTVLVPALGYAPALTLESNSTIRNIRFKVGGDVGIDMYGGRLESVKLSMSQSSGSPIGVAVRSGGVAASVIVGTTVEMPDAVMANYALNAESDTQQVRVDRSVFNGGYAVNLTGNALVSINRSKVSGSVYGFNLGGNGTLNLSNVLFVSQTHTWPGPPPFFNYGMGVHVESRSSATVNIQGSTFVGSGSATSPGNYGLDVERNGNNPSVNITAVRTAFTGFQGVIREQDFGGSSDVFTTFNDVFFETASYDIPGSLSPVTTVSAISFPDPGFRNAAAGDYRPLSSSPLVDRSSIRLTNDGSDIRGGGRPRNGSSLRATDLDIGAYEYQPAPRNTRAAAVSGRARVGRVVSCRTGTWTGGVARFGYQWYRGSRAIRRASRSTYRLTRSDRGARVKCTVKATSLDGAPKTVTTRSVRVS